MAEERNHDTLATAPRILTIPGLGNSGPAHWQSVWETLLPDCARVNLAEWDDPQRDAWIERIGRAIEDAGRPVILVAHSLGCLAVVWWAQCAAPCAVEGVVGALLVAPPDVEREGVNPPLIARFAPVPRAPLPFPAVVVGSEADPFAERTVAQQLAHDWRARFVNAGPVGHINSSSGLGEWGEGLALLASLRGHPSATL